MEPWALAILCVALVLAGTLLGGLAVFISGRYRRRHGSCKCCSAGCGVATSSEENIETQLTAAEKAVLQKISHTNGAVCLSTRIPESTLSVPISSVIPPDEAQSETATPALQGAAVLPPQPDIVELPAANVTPSSWSAPAGSADQQQQQQQPSPAAAGTDEVSRSPQSTVSGLGVIMPADPAALATPSDSTGRSVFTSMATVVTKPRKTPAAVVFHPSVSWSSPVDDKNRRSIIRAVPETMSNLTAVPLKVSVLSGKAPYQQSPRSAPISIDESNFESISSANTPVTPHILSSPCDSIDYVVVPPSPSISSLYGASIAGTLSRPPSVMSPRSVNMNKSTSSPGGLAAGTSMFSPPPVPNRRHLESRLHND
ncbi:hypothetical protein LPJ63_004333 [Coemansia sp. RSA 2711]|nr:hypothetical protein LPJ63_004333 [Coemansia sp. RSA 2711]KAJ1848688.1 hypothetical protein LPJ70_000897 [Coemansia sp. RSA 2708]KAJ2309159.1 hypothetical protein IWW54_003883 [Coemansia sp. RSA 2705]KAJ2317407.1 hypothetical protein IWW52_003143 [Coemansia sp. RSA 2704]KAJ2375266.1 hypothetical protein H4S02_008280 [Coemansia sp. RSA 2611]